MTVMRRSNSGKAIQVILDNNAEPGVVYQIPVHFVQQLLTGTHKYPFTLMTRLPFFVDPEKYKESPLYDPEGLLADNEKKANKYKKENDMLDQKERKKRDSKKKITDKKIEW